MGRAKADLPFGSESMLQRVVRLLSQSVNHVVVVAAADQVVPKFGSHVTVARDDLEYAGPLAGLAVGLGTLSPPFAAAYVTSCDVPFLNPKFVQTLYDLIAEHDIVVPFDEQHFHPLAAVYRTNLCDRITDLVAQGERRPRTLFERVRTLRVPTNSLEQIDPGLQTLLNLNTPIEYRTALVKAGASIPNWLDVQISTQEGKD